MADEEKKPEPPKPPLPPGFRAAPPPAPPLPGRASGGAPPAPPSRIPAPPKAELERQELERLRSDMEKKLLEMEKKVQEEREKALLANLRSQEEKSLSARVETNLRDVQDRLRRERREAEMQESKAKLEARVQEMESKLVQERETWVQALKNQMRQRESQEKEVESHFALRLQEVERRFIEEKAQWQRSLLAKEEELRNLKSAKDEEVRGAKGAADKLSAEQGILRQQLAERQSAEKHLIAEKETVLREAQMQRQSLERDFEDMKRRAQELQERYTHADSQARQAIEKEKELIGVKGELALVRGQTQAQIERLEHELQAARMAVWEREQRGMSEAERLQRELGQVGERIKAETEKIRAEKDAELRQIKSALEAALRQAEEKKGATEGALQRLQAVTTALEKELSQVKLERSQWAQVSQTQNQELGRLKKEMARLAERYHAELAERERRWQARERELKEAADLGVGPWMRKVEELQGALKQQDIDVKERVAQALADAQQKLAAREEEWQRRVDTAEEQAKWKAEEEIKQADAARQAQQKVTWEAEKAEVRRQVDKEWEEKFEALRGRYASDRDAAVREELEQDRQKMREAFDKELKELQHQLGATKAQYEVTLADAGQDKVRLQREAAELKERLKKEEEWELKVTKDKNAASEGLAKRELELRAAQEKLAAQVDAFERAEAARRELLQARETLASGLEAEKSRSSQTALDLEELKKRLSKNEEVRQTLDKERALLSASLEEARAHLAQAETRGTELEAAFAQQREALERSLADLQTKLETEQKRYGELHEQADALQKELNLPLGKKFVRIFKKKK